MKTESTRFAKESGMARKAAAGSNSEPSRRRFLAGSAIAAALPGLVGAGFTIRPARAQGTKTLIVGMKEGALRTLDPNAENEYSCFIIIKNLYDTLVTFSGPSLQSLSPSLAAKWEVSNGGLTYTFDLDPRCKFSDGSPVKPEDVVFSLRRQIYLKGPGSYFLDSVKDIDVGGPNQVRFHMKSVFVDTLPMLVTPSLDIAQASAIKEHGGTDASDASTKDTARTWLDSHSVGSGPFVLDSWQRGSHLVLKRNVNYWGPPAPVDTIVFRFVNDSNTQKALLQRGDIHLALDLTPDLVKDLNNVPHVGVGSLASFGVPFLALHTSLNPVFKNPDVWDALKHAIDYEGLQQIYGQGGQFTGSIVPPGIMHALPAGERLKEDLTAAKAALGRAGHPNGFEFKLSYASDEIIQNVPADPIAQKIRNDLQRIGVTANLDPMPYSEELSSYRSGKLEADIHFFGVDYPGWTDFLPLFAPGGGIAGPRNNYKADFNAVAKTIADLTTKAQATLDDKQQGEYVLQAQRLLNQHGPFAWLFETNLMIAYRTDRIKRLPTNPIWYFEVGGMELV